MNSIIKVSDIKPGDYIKHVNFKNELTQGTVIAIRETHSGYFRIRLGSSLLLYLEGYCEVELIPHPDIL